MSGAFILYKYMISWASFIHISQTYSLIYSVPVDTTLIVTEQSSLKIHLLTCTVAFDQNTVFYVRMLHSPKYK